MKTATLLLLCSALLVCRGAAADDFKQMVQPLPGGDYETLLALQKKLATPRPLPPGGASLGETMLALADAGAAAVAPGPAENLQAQDYDSLYALLQKYRDDLKALGISQNDLESQLAALKARAAELQRRLDDLHPVDGLKIHAHLYADYDDFLLTGPGQDFGNATRYRMGVEHADITLDGIRGPLTAQAQLNFATVVGGFSAATGTVRSLYLELRTPVVVEVGQLNAQMSPLTLWRQEADQPYEAEPFKSERQELKDDLLLVDHSWQLQGVRLSTDFADGDRTWVKLQFTLAMIGYPGTSLYTSPFIPATTVSPQAAQPVIYSVPYNTYLGAWSAISGDFYGFQLAYRGTELKDESDSYTNDIGGLSAPPASWESDVHSGGLSWRLPRLGLALEGEYAESLYSNPNEFGNADFLTGTAAVGSLEWGIPEAKIRFTGKKVDSTFTSAPAQGRGEDDTYDPYGPIMVANSGVSVAGDYTPIGVVPQAPETRYNTTFLPPQFLKGSTLSYQYLQPYDFRTEGASPYGLATPNRDGLEVEASGSLWGGFLSPSAGMDACSEITPSEATDVFHYYQAHGGLGVDLAPRLRWPLSATAGWSSLNEDAGTEYSYSSTLLDLGATWKITPKLRLCGGLRHLDGNGTLPYTGANPVYSYFGYEATREIFDAYGAQLRWDIVENLALSLSYTTLVYTDKITAANDFEADQAYARFSVRF